MTSEHAVYRHGSALSSQRLDGNRGYGRRLKRYQFQVTRPQPAGSSRLTYYMRELTLFEVFLDALPNDEVIPAVEKLYTEALRNYFADEVFEERSLSQRCTPEPYYTYFEPDPEQLEEFKQKIAEVWAKDVPEEVKVFSLMSLSWTSTVDEAMEVAQQHYDNFAQELPTNLKELRTYLHPAFTRYGEEFYPLLASNYKLSDYKLYANADYRELQIKLYNMYTEYDPEDDGDVLFKDWVLKPETMKRGQKTKPSHSQIKDRFASIPFKVAVFRKYVETMKVKDVLELPSYLPNNIAGRAGIKMIEEHLSGTSLTYHERMILTTEVLQAYMNLTIESGAATSASSFGFFFTEYICNNSEYSNLLELAKHYFNSEQARNESEKIWDLTAMALLGSKRGSWAKPAKAADNIVGLMLQEMSEDEAIQVIRGLIGEDPPLPAMTATQWVKYLGVYKDYSDSPPSIIASLIR